MAVLDVFLYPVEANPTDVILRDPTVADSSTALRVGGIRIGCFAPVLAVAVAVGTVGITCGANAPVLALGAVAFDALADRLTNTTALSQANSFSAGGWVQRGTGTGDPSFFFEFDGAGFAWGLAYNGGNLTVTDEFGFAVDITAGAMAADTWIYVGLTNNAGAGQIFRGDESTAVGTASTGTLNASASLTRTNLGGASASSFPLTGKLSQWRVWNGVQLTQAEFEAERTSSVAVRTSGLVADWRMPSVAGKLIDSSGLGNDLTAPGAGPWQEAAAPSISSGSNLSPGTAGITIGTNAPGLTVDLSPASSGITLGANAPLINVSLAMGTAGATLSANAPGLTVNVAASPAGVTVGAQAPVLAVNLSPGTAGVVVGGISPEPQMATGTAGITLSANAPTITVGGSINPSAAGITLGANAPILSVAISPATAGAVLGASSPTIAVNLVASPAGVTVGANAPGLTVNLATSSAGVIAGANAPTLAVSISPSSAGAVLGANAPSLGATLSLSSAGITVGGNAPAIIPSFFPGSAGAIIGAVAPTLTLTMAAGRAGVTFGANAPVMVTEGLSPGVAGLVVGANAPALFTSWSNAGGGLKRLRRSVSVP